MNIEDVNESIENVSVTKLSDLQLNDEDKKQPKKPQMTLKVNKNFNMKRGFAKL